MQYNYSDALHSFIPKLKPKTFQSKFSVLAKIQDFKAKLKNLKSRSSERKVFLSESTKKPVNCSDLGYSYLPAVKSSSNLYRNTTKSEHPSQNFLKSNIISLSHRGNLLNNDKSSFNVLESKLIAKPQHKAQNSLIKSKNLAKSRIKKKIREIKPRSEIFNTRNPEIFRTSSQSSVKSQEKTFNLFINNFKNKSPKKLNYEITLNPEELDKNSTINQTAFTKTNFVTEIDESNKKHDRITLVLDKLIECNDSLVSSVSSVLLERIPRYKAIQ